MGKFSKWARLLTLIVVAVFAAIACSFGPTKGTITGKDYTPPFYWAGYYTSASSSCSYSLSSKRTSCYYYPATYTPGHWTPADYQLQLRDCSNATNGQGCNIGWDDVDQYTFDTHNKGDFIDLGNQTSW